MDIQNIKKKLMYGDFGTISKMINSPSPQAARASFERGNRETIEAVRVFIENRENLIKEYTARLES